MSRPYTPKSNEITHITIRCNNKSYLFRLKKNFSQIVNWLNCLPLFYSVSIHHATFMNNHFHLLLTPRKDCFGNAMSYFLTNLSKFLNFSNGRINHVFGNRYRPTVIANNKHLINVIRYIYQNPIRGGLVNNIEEYSYSTLGLYTGTFNPGIIAEPDQYTKELFDQGIVGRKCWLERLGIRLSDNDQQLMKQSLRRQNFRFSRRQIRSISNNGTSLIV